MPWKSRPVKLSEEQRDDLKQIANDPDATEKERCRALIVLLLGEGLKNKEIARRLNVHENTVVKWRGRWTGENEAAKITDYGELTGRPRSVLVPENLTRIEALVKKDPPSGRSRWTVRLLAKEVDLPIATVHRALKDLDIHLNPKSSSKESHADSGSAV